MTLKTMFPPVGLSYPPLDKIIEAQKRPGRLPPTPKYGALRPVALKGKTTLISLEDSNPFSAKFSAKPILVEGSVERFESCPELPEGMHLDAQTGEIAGMPVHNFPTVFERQFEVFGYNAVGVSSCQLRLEVVHGSWTLAHISLRPSLPDEIQPETTREIIPIEHVTPDKPLMMCDWTAMLHKVVAALEKHGTAKKMPDPAQKSGQHEAKVLKVGELVTFLGLPASDYSARRLVRTIEHSSDVAHDHKIDKSESSPDATHSKVSVLVAAHDVTHIRDVDVYLVREEHRPEILPAIRRPKTFAHAAAVVVALDQKPEKKQLEDHVKDKIAKDFSRLMPSWAATVESKSYRHQDTVARWRTVKEQPARS